MDPLRDEMRRATEAARIEPCQCSKWHTVDAEQVERAVKAHAVFEEIKKEGGAASELTDTFLTLQRRVVVSSPTANAGFAKPDHDADKLLPGLIQKTRQAHSRRAVPFRIRFAVKEIQGFDIDGQPATVESFIAEMPDQAIAEIGTEIEHVLGLTLEEQLGFKLPTTSGAVETGQNQSTDAPLVSAPSPPRSQLPAVLSGIRRTRG